MGEVWALKDVGCCWNHLKESDWVSSPLEETCTSCPRSGGYWLDG